MCYSVVCHQKLELWSLILARLCIVVFPTSGETGGAEELFNRVGVALELDWIFPTLAYSHALSSAKKSAHKSLM